MEYADIWEKTLANNEKIDFEFSISGHYRQFNLFIRLIIAFIFSSFFYFASIWLSAFIFTLIFLCLIFYYEFYLRAANAYAFTNQRVLIHRGWLSTHTISIDYQKITDLTVVEPFFERILTNSGDLHIDTAGTPAQEIVLRHISSPYEAKKKLEEIKSKINY
ncbi:MAG: hypothetical protein UT31_C0040G0007 [Parcubacteria group bacterium GW2011_GWF2_39_13b]|nr:MAG: hypothetical protein UT31_C0040G0007 [Parcubacteria group bacterium GW2011_GWF2_39_13b]